MDHSPTSDPASWRVATLATFLAVAFVSACRRPPEASHPAPGAEAVRAEVSVFSTSTPPARALPAPPRGPFGLSMVSTASGKAASIDAFEPVETCADCHPRQRDELSGSMHGASHHDALYRRMAELARKEAGEEVYALCSACHAPQAVAAGLVPGTPEERLPEIAKAGLVCDTCHQVSALKGPQGPWKEHANASFELSPDAARKFGPPTGDDAAAMHEVVSRDFFQSSELCASCHTVIHPTNGLRLEHTYEEWSKSPYAEAGIQCQDCHMRTVDEARAAARTMKPPRPTGLSTPDGLERPVGRHLFVGGNADAEQLGGDAAHGAMAEERLRSAATIEIEAPSRVEAGGTLRLDVIVTNVGAGHHLPTSLTELREIWVDLTVSTASGRTLFRSGALDADGDIDPAAMRFGARGGDASGKHTHKPWEVSQFLWKRLIAAKAAARDRFTIPIPADALGPLVVTAELFYRSAPPALVRRLFPEDAPPLKTTSMAKTSADVKIAP